MLRVTSAEAGGDELGQVAGCPPAALRAKTRESIVALEDLAKCPNFDALHRRSMIARQGREVSLINWRE